MRPLFTRLFSVLLIIVSLSACQRKVCPLDAASLPIQSDAEKRSLWSRINTADAQHVQYEVLNYHSVRETPFLQVLVSGSGICGYLDLDISAADVSLGSVRDKKGKGYSGAELKHPLIEADSSNGDMHLRLLSVAAISD